MTMRFCKIILLGVIFLGSISSCKEDTLVFPEQIQEQEEDRDLVLAGPSNVKVTGTFDMKFRVDWQGVSDRVSKATITYQENGQAKKIEVTDFSTDFFIQMAEEREYTFELQYEGLDGTLSKVVSRTAINKGSFVDYVVENFELSKEFNKLRIAWQNEANITVDAKAIYTLGEKTYTMSLEDTKASFDTLETIGLTAGVVGFKLEFIDEKGRKAIKDTTFNLQETKYTTAQDKSTWISVASNQNSAANGASMLIDGIVDSDNHWHTDWYPEVTRPETVFPHEVELTLGEMIVVDGFTLYNRTGGSDNGVKTFDVYVREKYEDEYEKVATDLVQIKEKGANKSFSIPSTKPAKMIKFVFKDAYGTNTQFAHLAEIDINGILE